MAYVVMALARKARCDDQCGFAASGDRLSERSREPRRRTGQAYRYAYCFGLSGGRAGTENQARGPLSLSRFFHAQGTQDGLRSGDCDQPRFRAFTLSAGGGEYPGGKKKICAPRAKRGGRKGGGDGVGVAWAGGRHTGPRRLAGGNL